MERSRKVQAFLNLTLQSSLCLPKQISWSSVGLKKVEILLQQTYFLESKGKDVDVKSDLFLGHHSPPYQVFLSASNCYHDNYIFGAFTLFMPEAIKWSIYCSICNKGLKAICKYSSEESTSCVAGDKQLLQKQSRPEDDDDDDDLGADLNMPYFSAKLLLDYNDFHSDLFFLWNKWKTY